MSHHTCGIGVAVALLLAGPLLADTSGPAWSRHPWAGCRVGTWVRFNGVIKDANQTSHVVWTSTLLAATKESYKIAYASDEGPGTTMVIEQPAKEAKKPTTTTECGEETILVGGKRYRCGVSISVIDTGQVVVTLKIWSCPTVPGGIVRAEGSAGQVTWSSELDAFERK